MVEFRSDFDVELIQFAGGDEFVSGAARVSTKGWESLPNEESEGLIRYLMGNRHGSPFEHGLFTWRISCPIFVWREFMRHRIASYNEESGRYSKLNPVFYLPPEYRNLRQLGKPGAYSYHKGTPSQQMLVDVTFANSCLSSYEKYEEMLEADITREVARMVLPVNIYSSAWVSMNPRALMNFLSLRTKDEGATFPSYPMAEIKIVAELMEESFREKMPITRGLFRSLGSVCP